MTCGEHEREHIERRRPLQQNQRQGFFKYNSPAFPHTLWSNRTSLPPAMTTPPPILPRERRGVVSLRAPDVEGVVEATPGGPGGLRHSFRKERAARVEEAPASPARSPFAESAISAGVVVGQRRRKKCMQFFFPKYFAGKHELQFNQLA